MKTKTLKVNGVRRRVFTDEHGTLRFRCNAIIRDLVDAAREGKKLDMNDIALRTGSGRYTKNDQRELYRLIGYSIGGYGEIFLDDDIEDEPEVTP